jgi:hypothetical protein
VKVYAYAGDVWGCGHYRIAWPAISVQRTEHPDMDVELVVPSERQISLEADAEGRVIREHFPEDADVIVFQRPTSDFVVQAIPLLQRRGVAVCVDIDDDLAHIDPANPAWAMHQPEVWGPIGGKVKNAHGYAQVARACRIADLVTVSTPALAASYGRHGRVRVLHNRVPAHYLAVEHTDSDVVGWPGSLHSHPNDLQTMGQAIAQLGGPFRVIGNPEGVGRVLGLSEDPDGTGAVELAEWPEAVAQLGIGVAPLADTRFNRAKSWLKPLEMSAVGVPWVASPLPEYAAFQTLTGGGLIAAKPKLWTAMLRRLRAEPNMRAELSERGRSAVRQDHTMEGNAWRWGEAWSDTFAAHRGRHAVVRT